MPHRILVVDDEPSPLQAFERSLQLDGYTVLTATTAGDALDKCQENSFDLVILDFIMPKMDGIELLVRIRKLQPHIRSIIISGKLEQHVDERTIGQELGESVEADLYLHKPISTTALTEAVASVLRERMTADWRQLASEAVKGHAAKISAAKQAAKELRKHKKKGK